MININSIFEGPRTIALDVEMSFNVSYHYDQWGTNIPWTHIKQRQFMISAAWQWIGQDDIYSVSVLDDPKRFKKDHTDDYHVIKTLKEEIKNADAVIAYNGRKFDVKEINTGFVKHDLGPSHDYVILDPIQIARSKFRFKGGNSLANLCDFLELDVQKGKVELSDWIGATEGNEASINKIVKYNKNDIPPMVGVWDKIKAYAPAKINMNHWAQFDQKTGEPFDICPGCGSPNLERRGFALTRAGKFQRYQCKTCGQWSRGKKNIRGVNIR